MPITNRKTAIPKRTFIHSATLFPGLKAIAKDTEERNDLTPTHDETGDPHSRR